MAITISDPVTGAPFGPGFQIAVSTDLIGPQPSGTRWDFVLTAPANEPPPMTWSLPWTSNFLITKMLEGDETHRGLAPVNADWVEGQSAQLQVQLIQPGPTVVDDETVTVVMDRTTGANVELAEYLVEHLPASGQGLTTAEHNAVLQTNVGVIAMAGINPLELVGDLAAAIGSSAPLAFGSLGDLMGPLTGDGVLAAPPTLHIAMGLYWVATTIPAGLGHRHGNSEEYPARLVQWRTTHVVGGIEMCTEIVDAITHRELWRFHTATPHAIEYSVLPQVEIFARYWLFP